MKILISAIACEPGSGSEAKVGWDAIKALSERHQCHVITHSVYRESIEAAQASGEAASATFHYHGALYKWHRNRLLARLQSWRIYMAWQSDLLRVAQELHKQHAFDLAHHLTYATWRVASPLWEMPVPFVWGPIGGAGRMPSGFRSILSPTARLFEAARDASTWIASHRTDFLACVRRSAVVIAANEETEHFIRKYRGTRRLIRLPAVFFSDAQIQSLKRSESGAREVQKLRIFAGGNIIGSKGITLALRALAKAKQQGLCFVYTIAGGGPDVQKLKHVAQQLDLAGDVVFHDGLTGDAYRAALKASDIYLMPSFRETAGITMLEAILAGCYPIVAGTSATGEVVRAAGGHAIALTNTEAMVSDICDALLWCAQNGAESVKSANAAREWICSHFSERHYLEVLREAYIQALKFFWGKSY
jgi:glycosyltransferase involved in cell wall biosynthesis